MRVISPFYDRWMGTMTILLDIKPGRVGAARLLFCSIGRGHLLDPQAKVFCISVII
jgi:hypothetical protein